MGGYKTLQSTASECYLKISKLTFSSQKQFLVTILHPTEDKNSSSTVNMINCAIRRVDRKGLIRDQEKNSYCCTIMKSLKIVEIFKNRMKSLLKI